MDAKELCCADSDRLEHADLAALLDLAPQNGLDRVKRGGSRGAEIETNSASSRSARTSDGGRSEPRVTSAATRLGAPPSRVVARPQARPAIGASRRTDDDVLSHPRPLAVGLYARSDAPGGSSYTGAVGVDQAASAAGRPTARGCPGSSRAAARPISARTASTA